MKLNSFVKVACTILAVLMGTAFSCSAFALPIEVMGPGNVMTVVSRRYSVPAGTTVTALTMTESGIEYPTQASVRVGTGNALIPVDNAHTSGDAMSRSFCGIGGPIMTQKLTVPLTPFVSSGSVVLYFHFNQTDGNSSGWRVLALNLLDANGNPILPDSVFSQDDPSTWQPPLNTPGDITAGQQLWANATLMSSSLPGATPLKAHCGDCHASDARDLQYFNYSNLSIMTRAQFHGLSAQQGAQIASYIRSRPYKSVYARPWNPPYQPGPGIDSRSVSEWSAGAGLGAVLEHDADVLPYLFPGGIDKSAVSTFATLNMRELPENFPLPTWNQWLPRVHPLDSPWSARVTTDPFFLNYSKIESALAAAQANGTLAAIVASQNAGGLKNMLLGWESTWINFDKYLRDNFLSINPSPALDEIAYSTAKWRITKQWEIMQEFGLEGMAPAFYNARSDAAQVPARLVEPRSWLTPDLFQTSPHAVGINLGQDALTLGGSLAYASYFVEAWYHLQLILQPGNGRITQTGPFDYAYSYAQFGHRADHTGLPVAGWIMSVLTKGAQESQNGLPLGPNGFDPNVIFDLRQLMPGLLGTTTHFWDGYDPALRAQLINAFMGAWLDGVVSHSLLEYNLAGMTSPTAVIDTTPGTGSTLAQNFGGRVYQGLQRGAAYRVDPALLTSMNAWAVQAWPASAPTFQNLMNSLGLGISITPVLGNSQ